MNLIGDMTGPFYFDFAGEPSPPEDAAQIAVAALLGRGEPPAAPLTVAHYEEAARWHHSGRIGDAELAAMALLVSLSQESGPVRLAALLQRGASPDRDAVPDESVLPPLLELLSRHRLRHIKDVARLALLGWHAGTYPGVLAMGKVSALDLLRLQATGVRPVGIGLPMPGFQEVDGAYPGGFTHHDLCHLAKFRGHLRDRRAYHGQVGFFAAFRDLVESKPELLQSPPGAAPNMDLALVATDTNGDVRLLLTLFLERLLYLEAPEDQARLVSNYLEELGIDATIASAAAPAFRADRPAFLSLVCPLFEAYGALLAPL